MWLTEEVPGRHTQEADGQAPSVSLVFLGTCSVAEVTSSCGLRELDAQCRRFFFFLTQTGFLCAVLAALDLAL